MTRDRTREFGLGAIVVLVALLGLVADSLGDPVDKPEEGPVTDALYAERSVFCPALPQTDKSSVDGTAHHVAGPVTEEAVTMSVSSMDSEPAELTQNVILQDVTEPVPTDFTAFGGAAAAATSVTYRGPVAGLAAGGCSEDAAQRWYFPFGSSAPGFNGWIVMYNPFPDEAVARIVFLTESGQRSPSSLADVAIPAGRVTSIKVNDAILQQRGLAAEVSTLRGRLVAWQVMFAQPENKPRGVSMTLGASEMSPEWFFPAGAVGEGIDERISILNPSNKEALVTVSLITDDEEALQPPDLVEMSIGRRTSRELKLSNAIEDVDLGGVSVSVRSVNEVPIVVQRSVWYGQGDFKGFTSEIGATRGATSWWVGPGAAKPGRDSLLILNTGSEEARVDVELFALQGDPIRAADLSELSIPPGGRLRVPLDAFTGGRATAAIVTSDSPVVAERITYSSSSEDVATVMGFPLSGG